MKAEHQSCFNQMKKVYIVTWKPEIIGFRLIFIYFTSRLIISDNHLKRIIVQISMQKLKLHMLYIEGVFEGNPNWLCLSHIYNPYQQSETLPNSSINPNL